MAIVWGAWETGGSGSTYNEIRIGLDISWSTPAWNENTTATVTLYTENKYRFNNTQTATWTGSLSGSFSFSNTQGAGDVSSRGTTYYTHTYGSNPATFTFGANLSTYVGVATVSVSTTTPTRPAGVVPTMGTTTATGGLGYIDVAWSVSNSGSTAVDTYHVYKNDVHTWTYDQNTTSLRDSLGYNVSASYKVYAHNSVGWSAASNTASATSTGGVVNVKKSTTGYDKVLPKVCVNGTFVPAPARIYDNGQWKYGI